MKKVSFDFDGTLSKHKVQVYAKELIERGYDVRVTTSRYDEANKHLYPMNPTNDDLYKVTDALGISRYKILFTNMDDKANFMDDAGFLFHIDDDHYELQQFSITPTVMAFGNRYWKEQCNDILFEYSHCRKNVLAVSPNCGE